jgi:Ca2+-binding EF-hand superfamily protein
MEEDDEDDASSGGAAADRRPAGPATSLRFISERRAAQLQDHQTHLRLGAAATHAGRSCVVKDVRPQLGEVRVRYLDDECESDYVLAVELGPALEGAWCPGCRVRVLRRVAVRSTFESCRDPNVVAIGSLAAGTLHNAIDVRYDPSQPSIVRVLLETRHSVKGWVNASTSNGAELLQVLPSGSVRDAPPPPVAVADRPRKFAAGGGAGGSLLSSLVGSHFSTAMDGTPATAELRIAAKDLAAVAELKRVLRAAAVDSRERTWGAMFRKFDEGGSGLLSRRSFIRCVRRYVGPADMADADIAWLSEAVDTDRTGEISIDEFEQFLHTGADVAREIAAATRIQAVRRGRLVRNKMRYEKATQSLAKRADQQADTLKRRLRSLSYSRGGQDWPGLFARYDTDSSDTLAYDEFRHACRLDGRMDRGLITDRELLILFQRMDADGSGEIDYPEFQAFLAQGPSAEAEAEGCVLIQACIRGRRQRRALALAGIEMRIVDVGRDQWKYEKLTERPLWQALCHCLDPKRAVHGAVVVCSSSARALWLAERLEDRLSMVCGCLHAGLSAEERRLVLSEWQDARPGGKYVDERGRRQLLVLEALPAAELLALGLGALGVQLLINFDAPLTLDQLLLRNSAVRRRQKGTGGDARSWVLHLCTAEEVPQLERLAELLAGCGNAPAGSKPPPPSTPMVAADISSRSADRDLIAGEVFAFVERAHAVAVAKQLASKLALEAESKRAGDEWPEAALMEYSAAEARAVACCTRGDYEAGFGPPPAPPRHATLRHAPPRPATPRPPGLATRDPRPPAAVLVYVLILCRPVVSDCNRLECASLTRAVRCCAVAYRVALLALAWPGQQEDGARQKLKGAGHAVRAQNRMKAAEAAVGTAAEAEAEADDARHSDDKATIQTMSMTDGSVAA